MRHGAGLAWRIAADRLGRLRRGSLGRAEMSARFQRSTPPHTVRPWPLPRAQSPTIEALRAALAEARTAGERESVLREFRRRLEGGGTPLVEADDPRWCRITFVWLGEAEHGVIVQLNRVTDPLDPEDTMLERIAGSEVHALTLRLPEDWLGSYLFARMPRRVGATLHGAVDMRLLMEFARGAQGDPFARETIPAKAVAASGGLAIPDYAAARGPAAPRTALWRRRAPAAKRLGAIRSPAGGARLALHHWAAPGADEASPVVLLVDGEVWLRQFPVAAEIEDRIASGGFPPVHLLFLESGGPKQREFDYAAAPGESGALLAAVQGAVARSTAAGAVSGTGWIVAGQSLGGLFAALAATRHPDLVHAAVAQSPSLWWPSAASPWQREEGWFEERAAAREAGARVAPILLEAGAIDAGVTSYCRNAAALLRGEGGLLAYREYPAGHDALQWQATIVDALADAIRALAR